MNLFQLTLLTVPYYGILYYGYQGDVVVIGTENDDIITHRDYDSDFQAIIFSGGGEDRIDGSPGGDYIDTGSGDDIVYAYLGDDILRLGGGDDIFDGHHGNDLIYCGWGNDLGGGGIGDDTIFGQAGNDTLSGGNGYGNDNVSGGNGDDELFGVAGNNVLRGGSGNDTLTGGLGRDWMVGGDGFDSLTGGDGIDHYVLNGDYDADRFDFADTDSARDVAVLNARENSVSQFAIIDNFAPEDEILIRIYPESADTYNGWFSTPDGLGNELVYVSHSGGSLSVFQVNDTAAVNVEEVFL